MNKTTGNEYIYEKINGNLKKLSYGLDFKYVDTKILSNKIIEGMYDGITDFQMDELAEQTVASLTTKHPDFNILAGRLAVESLHRQTSNIFSEVVNILYNFYYKGQQVPLVSEKLYNIVMSNKEELNSIIDYERDYNYDYFGIKTLEYSYLIKCDNKIIERPQHMIMRVAIGIHGYDIKSIIETYELMSKKYFIHATPTLYNSGTPKQQLSSCFLLTMKSDSIEGIFDTLKQCANISKYSGGIGISIHDIRASNSYICGTNGISNGIIPMLRVFNNTARYVDQSGKRKGSFAIYLETHHPDIFDFLELKKNHGNETDRARDLFYALWISDLFMKRVEGNDKWSLFCPNEAPGLSNVYGIEFEELYKKYESQGIARKIVNAQELWIAILSSQIETGMPYMVYKDASNLKSNQKNLGTIKSSNLCVAPETFILTDKGQYHISDLVNQEVNVWNGDKWSSTKIIKTGEKQKLITVNFSNNQQITCTPYHKFIIRTEYLDKKSIKNATRIEASKLKIGMKVIEIIGNKPNKNTTEHNIIVLSISDNGRIDDTYCFNEKENNAGVFNGILTGNCTEIIQYTSPDEVAVCNLASINLSAFVDDNKTYNFNNLYKVTKVVTKNLNKVIDINFYPVVEAQTSNLRHRPIGIGVQGLADSFAKMRYTFESDEASQLNKDIFETIYYAAIEASCEISSEQGPYNSYKESPISKGILQPDMWNITPSDRWDWNALRKKINKWGIRNSLLIAPMPTATTAQILGNNESTEPFTSNIYNRRVLSGEFTVINKYLIKDLIDKDLWTSEVRNQLIADNGSIQNISSIPIDIKKLYKTVWEIKQKTIIDQSADRGAFICQSQSLNIHMAEPNFSKLTSLHFYAWKKGLKTGMYYLRTRPKADAIKFTVDQTIIKKNKENSILYDNTICDSCSS